MLSKRWRNLYDEDRHCIVISLNSLLPSEKAAPLPFRLLHHCDAMTFDSKHSHYCGSKATPLPLECDRPLSCVSKATRRWNMYWWNNSPPLLWRIWSQAPRTNWGFTPMSSTASAANLSPLRPKQVRPHLARWNQGSSQVGYYGSKTVTSSICSNSVEAGWVFMVWFYFLVCPEL